MEDINNNVWKVIDCYFRDNPQSLVRHHTESYNDFFKRDIFRIVKDMNPIKIVSKLDESTATLCVLVICILVEKMEPASILLNPPSMMTTRVPRHPIICFQMRRVYAT